MSLTLFLNSLSVGLAATLLSLVVGATSAMVAWALSKTWQRAGGLLLVVSLLAPPFLLVNAWLGWLSVWRAVQPSESVALWNLPLTATALAGLSWPIPALLAFVALGRIPRSHLELESGLRGWRLIRYLVIPTIRPPLQAIAPLLLVLALANFTVPTLFQVRVFTEEFWVRFNTQLDPWGALSAAWPLVVLPGLLLAIPGPRFFRRLASVERPPARWIRSRLGFIFFLLMASAIVWLGLVVFFPWVGLLAAGRTWAELGSAMATGQTAWENSLLTSVFPATAVALTGLVVVSLQTRPHGPHWAWMWFLLPGVFLGVMAIQVFNRGLFLDFYQSMGLPVLVLSLRYFPLGWAILASQAESPRGPLLDVARLAGAGPFTRWRYAILPGLLNPLVVTWFLVFSLCLWDVETVVLIQPPGGETLALRLFNLLHYGHATQVNALAVLLLGTALGMAALVSALVVHLGIRNVRRDSKVGRTFAIRRWVSILAATLVGLPSGCGRDGSMDRTHLSSQLFDSVQIVGSRGTAPGQFNKPRSLVCDRDDNLYVVDMTGRVQKFNSSGQWLLQWQMPETSLGRPKGMGLDPEGYIVVVEPHYQRLNHFTTDGRLVAQWGRKGTHAGEFILPRSVVVTSRREYVVSEYTVVDRVQRFTVEAPLEIGSAKGPPALPPTGTPFHFVGAWGEPGPGFGQFNRAEGLGIDGHDQIYVADSCNHRIQVFTAEGRFVRAYGRPGQAPGEFSYPYDIKVDSDGRQYVCEFGNSRITILDAQDQLIEVLGVGGAGVAPGQFSNPWSIALDSLGNLYVADSQNHRVQKFLRRRHTSLTRPPPHDGSTVPQIASSEGRGPLTLVPRSR